MIELLTHESDGLIDDVTKCEEGTVALKVRAPNRWNGRTGENKLRGLDPKKIAVIGAEPATATSAAGTGKRGPQMRIGALKLVGLHYVRQHLREQFDKHTSRTPDFLARAQDVGILLQLRLHRLIDREGADCDPRKS